MSRIQRRSFTLLILLAMIGAVAYSAGLATRPGAATKPAAAGATDALFDWLEISSEQRAELKTHDPSFADDLKSMRATLDARRADFASALEDTKTPDDAIRSKLEAVIAANNSLERRIAEYLISTRQHLTTDQQRKLFGLAAQEVRRRGGGWQGERGAGARGRGFGYGGPPWQQNQSAAPQGGQRGRGWGRGGARQEQAPTAPISPTTQAAPTTSAASFQDAIHTLLQEHLKITRNVPDLPNGVETRTTSAEPSVAALIRLHVQQMKARLEAGQPVRGFDPLFREIFFNHEKINLAVENVDGGVKVVETSQDPQIVLLIRQHAKAAVSEFVAKGMEQMHQTTALPVGYVVSE